MREEDKQAIKRTVALLKIKCQEQDLCNSCSLYTTIKEGNHIQHGCLLAVPPAYFNAEHIISNM